MEGAISLLSREYVEHTSKNSKILEIGWASYFFFGKPFGYYKGNEKVLEKQGLICEE